MKLETEIKIVEALEFQDDVEKRKIGLLNAQIEQLEEKYRFEREIAELDSRARNIDAGITPFFSKESIDVAMSYFRIKARQAALEIEPIFKTIGEGFHTTIVSTFETAVNNLLEGGRDFAKTVREAFKASLRELASKALMGALTTNIEGIFKDVKETFTKKEKPSATDPELLDAQVGIKNELQSLKQNFENVPTATLANSANQALIQYLPFLDPANQSPAITQSVTQPPLTIFGPSFTPPPIQAQPETVGGAGAVMGSMDTSELAQLAPPLKDIKTNIESLNEETKAGITVEESPGIANNLVGLGTLIAASQGESKAAIVGVLVQLISLMQAQQSAGAASGGGGWGALISAGASFFGVGAANGGIMSKGFTPLADGGVVRSPTLGLVGEGRNNEAVVPLPNNREIPVEMRGNTGDTINIEQNFDFTNADSGSVAQLRTEARAIEERTFNRVFAEVNKGGKYAKIVGRR